ncbi:MAG: M1 family metallopeptidase [Clostridiales bacterium]|nr:M1 family metallopeptidase [Clostridiales bacterium]
MKKTSIFLSIILCFSILFAQFGCSDNSKEITEYQIVANFNEKVLTATQTVDYFNDTEVSLTELKFNLFGNAYRKDAKFSPVSAQTVAQSYPNGLSFGDMKINSVLVDGKDAEFLINGIDQNVLSVNLGKEIFPEEHIRIEIDFVLNLANVVSRTGYNEHTINLANFYPILCARDNNGFYECVYYSCGDPFFSDCANYKVTLTANKKYTFATSGKEVSSATNGEYLSKTYEIEKARSFAIVLSEKFKCETDTSTGVEINYFYYNDNNPTYSLDYAVKSMNYFNKTFGKYPYKTYSVVQTEFVQGGMEFPGLVMISDRLEEGAYGEVIVHETAHQWWQGVVGNNEVEYGFLDEGLAEYSVVLFYENHPEYKMKRADMIEATEKTFKSFCTVYDKLFGSVNTTMIRSLKDFSSEYEYVNIAYIKPCIMYEYLRKTAGEERFFKGLSKYYEKYQFKNAEPYDIVGVFEKIGADSNGYFDTFYTGKEII